MKPEILAYLAAFEQVAQHRSLTYAAHAIGVTPAALSQTIKSWKPAWMCACSIGQRAASI